MFCKKCNIFLSKDEQSAWSGFCFQCFIILREDGFKYKTLVCSQGCKLKYVRVSEEDKCSRCLHGEVYTHYDH